MMLARLDAGQCQLQRVQVDLAELLRQAWSPLACRAEQRQIQVEWLLDDTMVLNTDATLVSLIFRNLLHNAVSYANEQGQLAISSSVSPEGICITIENSASGLPNELAERAFDRFWRADISRAATGQHAGLGLPMCREAARALGGTLTVTAQAERFSAHLTLPQMDE